MSSASYATTQLNEALGDEKIYQMLLEMKQDFALQRQELESKINRLEKQLAASASKTAVPQQTQPTTRRRALKRMLAGATLAGLVASTALNDKPTQAATNSFDFNGTSGGLGSNNASSTTNVTTGAGADAKPIFFLNNNRPSAGGTNPDNLPIALRASSDNSFAIYASTTTAGSSAIYGQSASSATLTDLIFSDTVAGVTGVSVDQSGVTGLSDKSVGVQGRSAATFGVAGVSKSSIGGGFASTSTNVNEGAALQLGLRSNANGAPNASAIHSPGEFYLDKFARVHVCHVGNGVNPTAQAAPPGFGGLQTSTPTWRFLAPMTARPNNPPFTFSDNELHVVGEIWLNTTSGQMYVNTGTFSDNPTIQNVLGVDGTSKFKVVGGNPFVFLPAPLRILPYTGPGAAGKPLNLTDGVVQAHSSLAQIDADNTRTFKQVHSGTNFRYSDNSVGVPNTGIGALLIALSAYGYSSASAPIVPIPPKYMTVWQGDAPVPKVSATAPAPSMNFLPGDSGVTNNIVIVPLSASTGNFNVASIVTTNYVIDVLGYYSA